MPSQSLFPSFWQQRPKRRSPPAGRPGGRCADPKNPRYFTDGSGKAVYLTGAHTWANLQDQGRTDPPPQFDFDRYLDFLDEHHHNLFRLWAWEQARWAPWSDGKGPDPTDWFIEPNLYLRSGPGTARDGKPKFDLAKFNPAYFDRMRTRVQKAGDRGIYVSVMLFQGWSSFKKPTEGQPWLGHPYHPDNNIQQLNGNSTSDTGPDLNDPKVRELQAAYVRKVIDTVGDLDNVLYEVINEGGNKDWDWWVVRTVQDYEKTKAKQHPVGLTGNGTEKNAEMLASPADWISPGSQQWRDLTTNPRQAPATKVSILDTDHVFGVGGDQKWVWKAFLRGHNVLFMDPYGDPEWVGVLEGQKLGVRDPEPVRRDGRRATLRPAHGPRSGHAPARPGLDRLLSGQGGQRVPGLFARRRPGRVGSVRRCRPICGRVGAPDHGRCDGGRAGGGRQVVPAQRTNGRRRRCLPARRPVRDKNGIVA